MGAVVVQWPESSVLGHLATFGGAVSEAGLMGPVVGETDARGNKQQLPFCKGIVALVKRGQRDRDTLRDLRAAASAGAAAILVGNNVESAVHNEAAFVLDLDLGLDGGGGGGDAIHCPVVMLPRSDYAFLLHCGLPNYVMMAPLSLPLARLWPPRALIEVLPSIVRQPRHSAAQTMVLQHIVANCEPIELTQLLRTPNRDGDLPLHAVLARDSYPEAAMLFIALDAEQVAERSADGYLPLHMALTKGLDHALVAELLRRYPDACRRRMPNGRFPLHAAIYDDLPPATIVRMVQAYPLAAQKRDHRGRRPLVTYMFLRESAADLTLVTRLLEAFPGAAGESTGLGGMMPLHLALLNNLSLDFVWMFVHCFRKALVLPNSVGQLPLHLALVHGAHTDIVKLLIAAAPSASRCYDGAHRLPLEVARVHGSPPEIIQRLKDTLNQEYG